MFASTRSFSSSIATASGSLKLLNASISTPMPIFVCVSARTLRSRLSHLLPVNTVLAAFRLRVFFASPALCPAAMAIELAILNSACCFFVRRIGIGMVGVGGASQVSRLRR